MRNLETILCTIKHTQDKKVKEMAQTKKEENEVLL